MDEGRQPLSRKVDFSMGLIQPYRLVIIIRLVVLAFFLRYRIMNPVPDAYPLWLISVICEIWFATSWILDQFPKWMPVNRETYQDRLSLRYEKPGEPSQLCAVDMYVSTVDPAKEPPLTTANTILSILAMDYPVDKISCYLQDDGGAMLTFEALSETSEFARRWVQFCKKFSIEPRAPDNYFSQKIDYLKDKVQPSFVKERRMMKVRNDAGIIRFSSRLVLRHNMVGSRPVARSGFRGVLSADYMAGLVGCRGSMRNSRFASTRWWQLPRRFLRMGGPCKTAPPGPGTTPETTPA